MSFPPQEHKLSVEGFDPDTRARFRLRVDDDSGTVTLLRGTGREEEPLPRGLTPGGPVRDAVKREALMRFVRAYAAGRRDAIPRPPRCWSAGRPTRLGVDPVESALSLGESYLFVQGPPGSGKTWQGAHGDAHAPRESGSASPRSATRRSTTCCGRSSTRPTCRATRSRCEAGAGRRRSDSQFESRCFVTSRTSTSAPTLLRARGGDCVALTRPAIDVHAADTRSTCSSSTRRGSSRSRTSWRRRRPRSLILLGDPNQLPQVSRGSHPEASERSVLQHLLGEDVTVPPDRGLFLAETWRLRPELCAFTSDAYYEAARPLR